MPTKKFRGKTITYVDAEDLYNKVHAEAAKTPTPSEHEPDQGETDYDTWLAECPDLED